MTVRNPTHGYEALVSGGLTFAGVDQGIDFTGTGTVHAIADGIIERLVPSGSGWPGRGAVVVYRVTSGPAAGRRVYVAEDFTPAAGLHRGGAIHRGDAIGSVHSSWPGIEVGWANADGSPVAALNPNPHSPKPAGRDFNSFIQRLSQGAANLPSDLATAAAATGTPALGCATLLLLAGSIGASLALYLATGAPLWPVR